MHAPTALACLKESPDFSHFCLDRTREPLTGHLVVQPPERAVTHVQFLDVMDARPAFHSLDLEPGVEASRDSVLQRDVDAVGCSQRYRVITDPGNRPRNLPSSRASMPSGVSASLVTQTILVSAFVYWAGSSTKSNTSSGVTPVATAVPSPLTMASRSPSPSFC